MCTRTFMSLVALYISQRSSGDKADGLTDARLRFSDKLFPLYVPQVSNIAETLSLIMNV